jgi:hypothetical protein
VEARFDLFGDSTNPDARYVHGLHQMYHKIRNHFGCPNDTSGDEGQVEARFHPFGDSANLDAR